MVVLARQIRHYNVSVLVRVFALLGIYTYFYKNGVQYSVFPLLAVSMKMLHRHAVRFASPSEVAHSFHDRNEKSLFVES